jgi:hypothetical protein
LLRVEHRRGFAELYLKKHSRNLITCKYTPIVPMGG